MRNYHKCLSLWFFKDVTLLKEKDIKKHMEKIKVFLSMLHH